MIAAKFANAVAVKASAPVARRAAVRVRATEGAEEPKPEAPAAAEANSAPEAAPVEMPAPSEFKGHQPKPKPPTLKEAMAFSGPAPELINCRLSMLAFVAAMGAEIGSHESTQTVFRQASEAGAAVPLTMAIFSIASLIPILNGLDDGRARLGPFDRDTEVLNGRAAMLGLVALAVIEAGTHRAFFA
ncbi:unnamed protein product [Pedinophyceae sp. YPF-701]|nr:unnamed protein product [Pedinophyceae sp. YPF-701]